MTRYLVEWRTTRHACNAGWVEAIVWAESASEAIEKAEPPMRRRVGYSGRWADLGEPTVTDTRTTEVIVTSGGLGLT